MYATLFLGSLSTAFLGGCKKALEGKPESEVIMYIHPYVNTLKNKRVVHYHICIFDFGVSMFLLIESCQNKLSAD